MVSVVAFGKIGEAYVAEVHRSGEPQSDHRGAFGGRDTL